MVPINESSIYFLVYNIIQKKYAKNKNKQQKKRKKENLL